MRITFDEVTATDLMEFNELMLSLIKSEEKAKKKLKKAEEEPKVRKKPGPKPKYKAKEKLDRGRIQALYEGRWSVEKIADDIGASVEDVKDILEDELKLK